MDHYCLNILAFYWLNNLIRKNSIATDCISNNVVAMGRAEWYLTNRVDYTSNGSHYRHPRTPANQELQVLP